MQKFSSVGPISEKNILYDSSRGKTRLHRKRNDLFHVEWP